MSGTEQTATSDQATLDAAVKATAEAFSQCHAGVEAAERDIVVANAALAAANERADAAQHDDDPAELTDAVIAAEMNLRRATIAARVAEARKRHALEAHERAIHDSHTPAMVEGRRLRLESAKRVDQLRLEMHEAAIQWARGTWIIEQAHKNGRQRAFDGAHLGPTWPVNSVPPDQGISAEQAEIALWQDEH